MLERLKHGIRIAINYIYFKLPFSIRKRIAFIYFKLPFAQIPTAYYGLLSEKPPIIHTAITCCCKEDYQKFHNKWEHVFHHLKNRSAYFLLNWWWYTENDFQATLIRNFEYHHALQFPKHHFIHLCNTLEQEKAFQKKRLQTVFINQNCLVDEKIFRPISSVKKQFDAIYDARLQKYKRHDLAQHLSSLALLYDSVTGGDNKEEIDEVKCTFSSAYYFNHQPDGSYKKLTPEEVAIALNSCHVGLCLSQVEGAMYASIQYLLCGLPVVSTQSQGGRDVFFDPTCVEIVEDNPNSVRQGVLKQLQNPLTPWEIREKTLQKVYQHRERFQALIQHIYQQEDSHKNIAEDWPDVFFNKCLTKQYTSHVCQRV
jgi:glycosyltransferase involved in cell wall biosynthesis